MIIVAVVGGLGNQLFQYAIGRALATRAGAELKMDVTAFRNYRPHQYALEHLHVRASLASDREIKALTGRKRLFARFRDTSSSYRREKDFRFDPSIWEAGDGTYLYGYWQSERYFVQIQDLIRDEFRVRNELDGRNEYFARQIQASTNAVSVHIRRGDYVSNPETNKVHGTCPLEYYHAAVNRIVTSIGSPSFFVFSDDLSWARRNLKLSNYHVTFVDANDSENAHEDLRLMSMCKHNIIANSTFSWWGAWLNPNKQKRVIAPEKWFNDPQIDTRDLIPDGWIRL